MGSSVQPPPGAGPGDLFQEVLFLQRQSRARAWRQGAVTAGAGWRVPGPHPAWHDSASSQACGPRSGGAAPGPPATPVHQAPSHPTRAHDQMVGPGRSWVGVGARPWRQSLKALAWCTQEKLTPNDFFQPIEDILSLQHASRSTSPQSSEFITTIVWTRTHPFPWSFPAAGASGLDEALVILESHFQGNQTLHTALPPLIMCKQSSFFQLTAPCESPAYGKQVSSPLSLESVIGDDAPQLLTAHQLSAPKSQTAEPARVPEGPPPPLARVCSELSPQSQLQRARAKAPCGQVAYPESLQKVLPHPQGAPQGGLWPVLISWREARASGLSTADPGSSHPGTCTPVPEKEGGAWGQSSGGCPVGITWAMVGGMRGAQSLRGGLSYSWTGAGSCRVRISPGARAPRCSCTFAGKSRGLHGAR